jgi:hypothetical protein
MFNQKTIFIPSTIHHIGIFPQAHCPPLIDGSFVEDYVLAEPGNQRFILCDGGGVMKTGYQVPANTVYIALIQLLIITPYFLILIVIEHSPPYCCKDANRK